MSRYGAHFPPEQAWKQGKTAATAKFVDEAEEALAERDDLTDPERRQLELCVKMLKDGTTSLDDWQTVDEWLEELHHHHP